jgi:hypothetical protein
VGDAVDLIQARDYGFRAHSQLTLLAPRNDELEGL